MELEALNSQLGEMALAVENDETLMVSPHNYARDAAQGFEQATAANARSAMSTINGVRSWVSAVRSANPGLNIQGWSKNIISFDGKTLTVPNWANK